MRILLVIVSALLLAPFPSTTHAQWLAPAGARVTVLDATRPEPGAREISASKYVWRGAVIGAVTLGAIAAVLAVTAEDECVGCAPAFILAPIVLGTGAIVGAAIGYVVYRVRR